MLTFKQFITHYRRKNPPMKPSKKQINLNPSLGRIKSGKKLAKGANIYVTDPKNPPYLTTYKNYARPAIDLKDVRVTPAGPVWTNRSRSPKKGQPKTYIAGVAAKEILDGLENGPAIYDKAPTKPKQLTEEDARILRQAVSIVSGCGDPTRFMRHVRIALNAPSKTTIAARKDLQAAEKRLDRELMKETGEVIAEAEKRVKALKRIRDMQFKRMGRKLYLCVKADEKAAKRRIEQELKADIHALVPPTLRDVLTLVGKRP